MASGAKLGQGCALKRGNADGPPETFTKIAEVKNVTGPGGSRDTVDVTSMDSTGGFREYIAGLGDPGEITFSSHFIPSDVTQEDLLDDFNNKVINNWKIEWPQFTGTPYLTFAALVTSFAIDTPLDGAVMLNITLKVSGQVTLTTP